MQHAITGLQGRSTSPLPCCPNTLKRNDSPPPREVPKSQKTQRLRPQAQVLQFISSKSKGQFQPGRQGLRACEVVIAGY